MKFTAALRHDSIKAADRTNTTSEQIVLRKKAVGGGDAHNREDDSAERYSTSRTINDMWTNPIQWPIRNNSGFRSSFIFITI